MLFFQNRMVGYITPKIRVDVFAYNLKTKKFDWRIDKITPEGNSSLAIANSNKDNIFFLGMYKIYCIAKSDGKIVWEREYPIKDHSFYGRIVLMDNKLLLKPDNVETTYAFDPTTGAEIWHCDDTSNGSWNPIEHNGLIYFNTNKEGNIYAVQLSDGKLIWQYPIDNTKPAYLNAGMIAFHPEKNMIVAFDGIYVIGYKITK